MFTAIIMRGSRDDPRTLATGETLLRAMMPYSQADVTGIWQDERALIAQAIWHNTPESLHERAPEICSDTGRVIAAWVRLDNRDELCAALKLDPRPTLTDPQIILAAHRAWGADCANRLEGDFSFVIYDPSTHETYCARDSLGARPLFYRLDEECLLVATTSAVFCRLNHISASPSEAWMARFLGSSSADQEDTAFENVKRLSPACYFAVSRCGSEKNIKFFEFADTAPKVYERNEKWVERYREAFFNSVHSRLRSNFLIGAESSGGIDSSSIVAVLAQHLPHAIEDLSCFAICTLEREADYLLDTAMHCGLRHTYVQTRIPHAHSEARLDRMLKSMGFPAEHGLSLYSEPFFRICQDRGIRTLISGYGGDEMVTHPASYLLRELFNAGEYSALLNEFEGRLPLRFARFMRFLFRKKPTSSSEILRLNRYVDSSMLSREVIEAFGLRDRYVSQNLQSTTAQSLNQRILDHGLFQTRRLGRLESGSLLSRSYGVEYAWPMFDRNLMQQYLATPAIEKRHRSMGRYLHRRAVAHLLPERIIWKPTKSLGGMAHWRKDLNPPRRRSWNEIAQPLRHLIDEQKYHKAWKIMDTRQQDSHTFETVFRAQDNLDKVEQLAVWLEHPVSR